MIGTLFHVFSDLQCKVHSVSGNRAVLFKLPSVKELDYLCESRVTCVIYCLRFYSNTKELVRQIAWCNPSFIL